MYERPVSSTRTALLNPNSVVLCFYARDNGARHGPHSQLAGVEAKLMMNNSRTSDAKFLTST
jgi:hypothetical protein